MRRPLQYSPALTGRPPLTAGDGLILLGLAATAYIGARLAFHAPHVVRGPEISLSAKALPWYALLSVGRMAIAYLLSLVFSLAYGYTAARHRRARAVLIPLLDVLQSVPILSFLPVVLLGLSVILPPAVAAELASIVLIFTSQAWNMTFSFYQSVRTVPTELREGAAVFRLGRWFRFRTLELPFAAVGLVWNSMMSWSGGWYFLMASEIFNVGAKDFRLPGLGSYLQTAASVGDFHAVGLGIGTLVLIILTMDQLVWRPVLAWAERFKYETVSSERSEEPWVVRLLRGSWLVRQVKIWVSAFFDRVEHGVPGDRDIPALDREEKEKPRRLAQGLFCLVILAVAVLAVRGALLLAELRADEWLALGVGLGATLVRVVVALSIALAVAIPLGVLIGTNERMARVLQPMVQVSASIPATALFPVLVVLLAKLPGGLNVAAVILMLMGTAWYLLFNVIAGAAAIPQDLKDMSAMMGLTRRERWKTLILPAIFPFIITGSITASGGAWNASIVAEYFQLGGKTLSTTGIGAEIAAATAGGRYALLLAGTLMLVLVVVMINRFFWSRLYRQAEGRFRIE